MEEADGKSEELVIQASWPRQEGGLLNRSIPSRRGPLVPACSRLFPLVPACSRFDFTVYYSTVYWSTRRRFVVLSEYVRVRPSTSSLPKRRLTREREHEESCQRRPRA